MIGPMESLLSRRKLEIGTLNMFTSCAYFFGNMFLQLFISIQCNSYMTLRRPWESSAYCDVQIWDHKPSEPKC